jgi:hypothetical protein
MLKVGVRDASGSAGRVEPPSLSHRRTNSLLPDLRTTGVSKELPCAVTFPLGRASST